MEQLAAKLLFILININNLLRFFYCIIYYIFFRTILYEVITRRFPFSTDSLGFTYESEVVIFLVGHGHRQPFKGDTPTKLKVRVSVAFACATHSRLDIFRISCGSVGQISRRIGHRLVSCRNDWLDSAVNTHQ